MDVCGVGSTGEVTLPGSQFLGLLGVCHARACTAGTIYNRIEDKRVCRKRNNGEEIGQGAWGLRFTLVSGSLSRIFTA